MNYSLLRDEELVDRLVNEEDENAFQEIYNRYWKLIFLQAYRKIGNKEKAEGLTQDLFMSLWDRRNMVGIQHLSGWLNQSIRYAIINFYKSQAVKEKYRQFAKNHTNSSESSSDHLARLNELSESISHAMDSLPEKTRMVFKMSREENKPVKEIADLLDLSEKAVEYHISQSLKKMRIYLKEYLMVILFWLFKTW
ncbi:RNA polymerase sigma-70 factor (ECF subfamily) [Algoriphagus sp. 4150]|uniref:RNA polymerase sigma-70 factor n=1 Tax=Algoriphagus sp. 4150 TaxID=2817756 RepID=UPI002860B8E2|nr:RNA polymerase sigma-70 factor [Algoriphagus sp. 4150]MDR7131932.1 RNA polymerase sigma-70 factor (ECF subfamily) [Algoriphagus sp. 4150]